MRKARTQKATPASGPQAATPASGPQAATPASGPQAATPASGPQAATPASGPQAATPASGPQAATPASGPQAATASAKVYWKGAHTTHCLRVHLVFVPKYRRRVLQDGVAIRLEELLRQGCQVNKWRLEELAVRTDHVHLLLQFDPRWGIPTIVQRLKGVTSRVVRAQFPELEEFLWGASFWSDGYFAETVGSVDDEVIRRYIREQHEF